MKQYIFNAQTGESTVIENADPDPQQQKSTLVSPVPLSEAERTGIRALIAYAKSRGWIP